MLLDFLHLSRNRYVCFRNRASKVGMLHWIWRVLTLALLGRLYRALHPKLYATRNFCMHDFLKLHHNCDAYMGVQKERKTTFLTAFELWTSGKGGSQLVCCTILTSWCDCTLDLGSRLLLLRYAHAVHRRNNGCSGQWNTLLWKCRHRYWNDCNGPCKKLQRQTNLFNCDRSSVQNSDR